MSKFPVGALKDLLPTQKFPAPQQSGTVSDSPSKKTKGKNTVHVSRKRQSNLRHTKAPKP